MNYKRLFFLFLIIVLSSIIYFQLTRHHIVRGFYYWKTSLHFSANDRRDLKRLKVQTLYVKLFDVAWDFQRNAPVPVSPLRLENKLPKRLSIVPTTYITNETLAKSLESDMPLLARHIREKVFQTIETANLGPIHEIQLDCDWTMGTQEKYFTLIRAFRRGLPPGIRLSATIRLHQVKYVSQTGVPPVDRGMLMFYNLESPANPKVKNSILDLENSRAYLSNLRSYPLPMDIALPIYSWGSVFQGEKFVGLIANLTKNELLRNPDHFRRDGNFFVARKNTWIRGAYIYKNDRIRPDESSASESARAARFLARKIQNRTMRVVVFHYDQELLRRAGLEKIENLYRSAR